MRTFLYQNRNLAVAVLFACCTFFSKAQTLAFTTGTNVMCGTTPTYVMVSMITSSVPGTANHLWSINTNSCSYLFSSSTYSATYHTFCPGTYTIHCTAVASNTAVTLGTYSQVVVVSAANAQWNVSPSQQGCAGTTFTMTYSNATTYTTVGPGVNIPGSTALLTPTANTCYSVLSSGSTCSISVFCLSVTTQPTITVNNATICAGDFVDLYAPGAFTYTWSHGPNTWSTQVSPTVSTCYTVTGSMGTCPGTGSAVACVVVNTPPVLTFTPGMACAGNPLTYTAQGATNYTWMAVSGNSVWSSNSSTVTIPPQISCFMVAAQSTSNNCVAWSGTICPTFVPTPTITISSNTNVVCSGDTIVLTAGGALTYTWSNVSTGSQIYVTPTSNTCYSVMGSNSSGCNSMASICVSVNPGPQLTVTGPASVCLGSSATYTASGGTIYIWNTNATGNTMNILTTNQSTIAVSSPGSNGCWSTYTTVLYIDSSCADVWPGDANSDGVVSSTDVLEIGLGFNSTGSSRSQASNNWTSQYATAWSGTVSSGKNLCHADCNGDGTVNHSDTVAIFNNFNLKHAFKPSAPSSNPDITLVGSPVAFIGIWNVADVVVGSSTANINQLYGVTFDLNFDENLIDDAYLVYNSSFLNASNQNVEFRKNFISNGTIVGATVRTDKNDVAGNGKIAELHFKVKAGLAPNTQLDFSVSNSQKVGKNGTLVTLNPGTLSQQAIHNTVGMNKQTVAANVRMYPNPASSEFMITATPGETARYTISDLSGRVVSAAIFNGNTTVDVTELTNGVYFVNVETSNGNNTMKLIVDHK